ncbi:maleate isomerase [Cohaesibacter sp. ES.047]|uniref:aspartate racemase/maleate isomerase family protein n=1 Tax=Cohaesibacter sp. ES.047 TaxID=1798205 RepID=UPI000BB8ACD9|nr:aspartate/glutamate racemase family protein [Cohaesibacter sp. ES.047]SNY92991.1 maleate isomerase [Cohaesibacter sp. ES.047]
MVKRLDIALSYRDRPVPFRIGLLLLETDHTTELEFARHMPHDKVGVYCNRVEYANPTTPENLLAMLPKLGQRAEQILPGSDLDAVYYGCTAASFVIGNERVEEAIHAVKPKARVITPTSAAMEAFEHLKIGSVALLTPYLPATSEPLETYFESHNIAVKRHSCLGLEDDRDMARLDADSLIRAAENADDPQADALFISCTALRSIEVATELEMRLGKPVITSNQAAVWSVCRLLGLPRPDRNACRLFETLPERL